MQITMQPQDMHGNLCVQDHRCVPVKLYAVLLESTLVMIIIHAWYTIFFSFSRVSNCVHYFVFLMSSPHVIACYLLNLCASLTYMRQ